MEKEKSWRHEGGKFKHRRLSMKRSGLQEPLVSSNSDVEAAQSGRRQVPSEKPTASGWGGDYVKSIVYGGLDAIVTSFALVASVSGGDLPAGNLLVSCLLICGIASDRAS